MPRSVADFTFKHYRRIVEAGLESAYRFIGFYELAAVRDSERYLCLLWLERPFAFTLNPSRLSDHGACGPRLSRHSVTALAASRRWRSTIAQRGATSW